jgi:hypothetical protein
MPKRVVSGNPVYLSLIEKGPIANDPGYNEHVP